MTDAACFRRPWRMAPAVAVAALGLLLTAAIGFLLYSRLEQQARMEFRQLAENRRLLTQGGLRDLEQYLGAITVLLETSKSGIGPAGFAAMGKELLPDLPGVLGISWIPIVPGERRGAFERDAAQAGLPGYRISEFADGALRPAAERPQYYPMLYTAGALAASSSPGFDTGSDPLLQPLLERARATGGIAASAVTGATGSPGRRAPFYLISPVHRPVTEQRPDAVVGFVGFAIDPGRMILHIHDAVRAPRGLDFYFFAADDGPQALPFYVRSSFLRSLPAPVRRRGALEAKIHATEIVTVGDSRWAMIVVPFAGGPGAAFGQLWLVLAAGVALTGLAAAYLAASVRHAARREGLLAQLRRHDAILDAVTNAAAKLAGGPLPADAVTAALRIVGEAVAVSRTLVLEATPGGEGDTTVTLRYAWQADDVPVRVDPDFFASRPPHPSDVAELMAPLRTGRPVLTHLAAAQGGVRQLLDNLGIVSLLIVPILVEGRYWGQIGFDDCRGYHQWTGPETDALKTLAELIGSAIARMRYIAALSDADRIVESSPTILYRARADQLSTLTYVSDNVTRILGYPVAFLRSPNFYRGLVHADDDAVFDAGLRRLVVDKADTSVFEFRARTAAGEYRYFENRAVARRGADGSLDEIEGLMIDMTERKAIEARIAELARTDALTGLANRRSFLDRLHLAFAEARRGAAPFAVLSLDLDHFKDVNDGFGHPAGDQLLRAVAERLLASLREIDLPARFGGDEFVVLQADVTDPASVGALAEKLRDRLAAPYALDGNEVRLTASIGIAPYADGAAGAEEILAQADRALYRAKAEGRDRYRFHSEEIDTIVHEQVALVADLRAALGEDQLEIYYQPQVAVRSGAVVGMEALLRWHHPTRGLLAPGSFIPAAERSGAIVPLGQWVLDRACRQMRSWRDDGLMPPVMAVNLSATQLRLGRDFARSVAAVLDKWGLSPHDLEFDVSEAVLLEATRGNPEALERLQRLGVSIAIDDFGSGYTSIGHLRSGHVKRFKIAPQFIEAMTHDAADAAVVRAMISLADQLDIEIIAEGIETAKQSAFLLSASDTAVAQGFYFSRPMPASQATELLRRDAAQRRDRRLTG